MLCKLVVDRNVSEYLATVDFVALRRTCRTMYLDDDAWNLRVKHLPINASNAKHKLGLHYLLQWSLKLTSEIGSDTWFQEIADWLEYKISIRIMHSFILTQSPLFLMTVDLSRMSSRQRIQWLRLAHRYRRLYKPKALEYNVRPVKRHKSGLSCRRIAQSCCG